jgi:A/G-specific adenine glycosylase
MSEVPSSDWAEDGIAEARALAAAPVDAEWNRIGRIGHTFTHFHLRLDVWGARTAGEPVLREAADPERCFWVERARLTDAALPSVMRKVVALASRHTL